MGLKCKLQKSAVPPSIVEKSDKVLVGFFQGFSIFNTSQILFLASFLSLIGFLIWFSQPLNSESESDCSEKSDEEKKTTSSSSSTKPKSTKTHRDDNEEADNRIEQSVHKAPRGGSNRYPIDTIYESVNENIYEIQEKTLTSASPPTPPSPSPPLFSSNVTKIIESAVVHDHRHERPKSLDKNKNESYLNQYFISNQTSLLLNEYSNQNTTVTNSSSSSLASSRQRLENQESDDDTNNLINNLINDLIIDEESATISKSLKGDDLVEEKRISSKLVKTSSATSENTASTLENEILRNSLLELYDAKHVHAIEDHFQNLDEISKAIQTAGLENSQLIFGIDFTISNLENGTKTFNGRSLHYFDADIKNPYQKVIEILGKTLECFDVDGKIPAFGFGDSKTKDRKVFSLKNPNISELSFCNGFKDVLKCYNETLKDIQLSGPTNFAPLIREAIKIVRNTKQYHILVIVADGQVTNERQTRDAIVEASKYALSIIMVGVGDGPWDTMHEFDDSLPKRQFDNFQFVNYHSVIENSENPDEIFALHALMEIPDQYKEIKELGLLNK